MGYLLLALLFSTLGNIAVKLSAGFQRKWFSLSSFLLIGICIYFLTLSVQFIEVGIAYAMWSGVSIGATTMAGIFLFNEGAGKRKLISIGMIICGVLLL